MSEINNIKAGDTGRCGCGCGVAMVVREVENGAVRAWAISGDNIYRDAVQHRYFTPGPLPDETWARFVAWKLEGGKDAAA